MKKGRLRVDPDGVTIEYTDSGRQLSDVNDNTRTRFQDIIAAKLNTNRALRAMVLPLLAEIEEDVQSLRTQLDRIEGLLTRSARS